MSLRAFEKRWLGKRTDADGVFGYQCVDLIKQYAKEELGMRPGAWGNAIDYWTNTRHPLLSKYTRVKTQSPKRGDIVIFHGNSGNPYGHIAIATSTSTMLEQNGATGDGDGRGGDEVRYRTIPKSRIAGVLRPKSQTPTKPKGNNSKMDDKDLDYIYKYGPLHRTRNSKKNEGEDVYKGQSAAFVIADHARSAEYKKRQAARKKTEQEAARVPGLESKIRQLNDEVKKLKSQPGTPVDTTNEDIKYIRSAVDWIKDKLKGVFK